MPSTPKALAPPRIRWALDLLELPPRANVLEIGFGSGVAAQHILAHPHCGSYQGFDPSPAATKAAHARNAEATKKGRAYFIERAFDGDAVEPALFDCILAVNVNLYWTDDGEALRDIARVMHAKSQIVLVYDPPSDAQRDKIAKALKANTPDFFEAAIKRKTLGDTRLVALTARRIFARRALT